MVKWFVNLCWWLKSLIFSFFFVCSLEEDRLRAPITHAVPLTSFASSAAVGQWMPCEPSPMLHMPLECWQKRPGKDWSFVFLRRLNSGLNSDAKLVLRHSYSQVTSNSVLMWWCFREKNVNSCCWDWNDVWPALTLDCKKVCPLFDIFVFPLSPAPLQCVNITA